MHASRLWARQALGAPGLSAAALFALMGSLTGLLTGCTPTLDWREARLEAGLVAMFPCRPVGQSRQLALAGAPVTMSLRACEAGGNTYAVGMADVKDPARVGLALGALREASEAKLAGAASAASGAWSVDGMTPQAMAGRWHLSGQRPDGGALAMETAVFARGTWVVQASVIGGQLSVQTVGPFFEGLRFGP